MSAVTLQLDALPAGHSPAALRRACNELVGLVFGQLLREARQNPLARGLTDSPAGRIFQGQLDDVLVQSAARGDTGRGVFSALGEGLYRQLAPAVERSAPTLDRKG